MNQIASQSQHRFEGAVVIVTGGTKGIGRGIAEAFLEAGAEVIVCARHAPEQPVQAAGRSATFLPCDVCSPASIVEFVQLVVSRHGRIDVLVNNAGGAPGGDSATMSPRLVERIVQLNMLAPFYCAQAVNRVMQDQQGGGAIINISSVAANRPAPGAAAYGAAKAGLSRLTETLAMEWGPKVRVNAVVVGLVKTEGSADYYGGTEGMARIDAMLPLRRMAEPADIGAACVYLASPAAAYVSGAQLAVHGGGERPAYLQFV